MKKFSIIFASLFMLAVSSCSKYEIEDMPQMVTVSIDCSVGETTRANNNSLYNQIYNKVASKELIADSYSLKFTNKVTGESFDVRGNWNTADEVSIKVGTYRVTGTSTAYGIGLQDKCSVKFDTEATITTSTSKLNLKADYDCFLLIFDKKVVNDAYILYGITTSNVTEKHFFECGDMLYGFSKKLYNEDNTSSQFLYIDYKDNNAVQLTTNKLNPKIGEYYIFDEYTSTTTTANLNFQTIGFTINKMNYGKL